MSTYSSSKSRGQLQISTTNFATDLPAIFEADGDVDVAVAFVSGPGLELVRTALRQKMEAGHKVRLLLDLEEGATDPTALWELVALNSEFPSGILTKAYIPEQGILHSKIYISKNGNDATLITGSANLSRAALQENVEHGLHLVGVAKARVLIEATAEFERLWNSPHAFPLNAEAARLYEIYAGLRRTSLARGNRRARGSWQNLITHLAETPATPFDWPSTTTAFVIGAITARGYIYPESLKISIPLLFRSRAYKDQRITVRNESVDASGVLPSIPETIANSARRIFPNATVATAKMRVDLDFQDDIGTLQTIAALFSPRTDCNTFHLPTGLSLAGESVVAEFIRGFAVASALLTDSTSMPSNSTTGLPGQMVVWLRPKQNNGTLYDQIGTIITRRLHITVYHHRRSDRDPHLKLLCDEFQEIGFGIDWWDRLLQAGAEYNRGLFA